ncbi:flagellar motor stator protein MotA [Marivita geojedonensis]|uniref:Flagellar motor protein MotA n=1 Tax=Marivita geojedonensis TaxID=1123756 RepID=A0A1X4NKC4_9RHOB|nr:flagellar motor stator protein MotA [Marivita geojedonensis]OSQ50591.1 flagellar motor protein MotA [Marivita geojedonensis]PRY79886.1 chemotaxis protein MotA [Marivita geojedonensis]
MIALAGIAFTFVMVFGGYLLAGGKLGIILKSLPFELMMIGGAAVGAFAVGNSFDSLKQTGKDTLKVFKGSEWKAEDYNQLLQVLYQLISVARKNPVGLEAHIDNPEESEIFTQFPRILKDHAALDIICDTLRSASMNYDDPMQVEELLDKKIDETRHHREHSVHGLQSIADGLPALGIVAAVLGVIKTMGSIDQPPKVLGKLIGGALVGTFLGVFLAYCLVAPFASKVKAAVDDDINFYRAIKEVLVSHLHQHPPKICLEVARQSIPHHFRPGFSELDDALRSLKNHA